MHELIAYLDLWWVWALIILVPIPLNMAFAVFITQVRYPYSYCWRMKEITNWIVVLCGVVLIATLIGVWFGPMRWWHAVLCYINFMEWAHCNKGWISNLASIEAIQSGDRRPANASATDPDPHRLLPRDRLGKVQEWAEG